MGENEIQELRRENEALRARVAALTVVQRMARRVSSELELAPLLDTILASAIEVMNATTGSLLLYDPATDELVFEVVASAEKDKLLHKRMPQNRGIAGWVFTHGEPLIVANVDHDNRFYKRIDETSGFQTTSLICVPMITKGQKLGVLEVLNKRSGGYFNDDDIEILSALAAQSATAIENARLYEGLREEKERFIVTEQQLRDRLARAIHDGPAQSFSALDMNVAFVQKLLRKDPRRVEEELQNVRELAAAGVQQFRTLIFELRPMVLEAQGLVPALKVYIQSLQQEVAPEIHVLEQGESCRLPARTETLAFSTIQEALSNACKFSDADNVWLDIATSAELMVITVRDDGRGQAPTQADAVMASRADSPGLLTMQERAELIGADIKIEAVPEQGTLIRLEIPLAAKSS